jgi:predicted nucleic acid-binding Zn finger protein
LEGEKLSEKDYRDVLRALEPISVTSDPAELSKIYGSRFAKAWELLKERAVKKYVFNPSGRVMWIVVGKEREYIIYPAVGYCQCDDFFFAVMDGKALACQHLIAQRLAEELSDYELVEAEDRLFNSLMEDKRRLMALAEEV